LYTILEPTNTNEESPESTRETNSNETKAKKKRIRTCPVPQCSTLSAHKGFYLIPEHPERRQAWLTACKLPESTLLSTKICWKHFLLTDFKNEVTAENIEDCKFGQLKKNVVPSQNLPEDPIVVKPRSEFKSEVISDGPEVIEISINSVQTESQTDLLGNHSPTPVPIEIQNITGNSDHDYTPLRKNSNSLNQKSNEELIKIILKQKKANATD